MFKIYSKPDCPFCVQSKMLLTHLGQEYNEEVVDSNWIKSNGFKTVPQVYHHKDDLVYYIGGFEDLQDYLVENNYL